MFKSEAEKQVVQSMDVTTCTAAVKLAFAMILKGHPDNKDKSIFEIAYPEQFGKK